MAARPRTLPAAVAPVLVGHRARRDARAPSSRSRFLAALIGALFIQVGTNLSNDYSDARRGADTEDRLGPVRVTAGGLVPPRQVLIATYVAFGVAVLAGTYLIATAGLGAAARRARRRSSPACSTRAGRGRTATRGSARCSCSSSSASSRWRARYFAQTRGARLGGARARRAGRAARQRDPRRQQRARPRDRPARGQADAGGAARARARRGRCTRRWSRGAFLTRAAAVGARLALALAAARLAGDPARRCRSCGIVRTRTDGPSLNGALAGTGRLQLAFCVLLSAGLCWRAEPMPRSRSPRSGCALRAPLRTAWGELRERELLRVRLRVGRRRLGRRRGGAARALRRRAARRRWRRRWTPTRRVLRGAAPTPSHAELLAACAAERDAARRRSRRSTSRCGTAPAAGRAGRWRTCSPRARRPARRRSTRRSAPRTARAPRPQAAAAAARAGFGCVKVKVGIGDDAGRVAAVRAAVGPGRRDPGRRQRRLVDAGRGARQPPRARARRARVRRGAGARRRRAARGAGGVARAGGDGRDGRRARRRRRRARRTRSA